jgi:hypothetical protein
MRENIVIRPAYALPRNCPRTLWPGGRYDCSCDPPTFVVIFLLLWFGGYDVVMWVIVDACVGTRLRELSEIDQGPVSLRRLGG